MNILGISALHRDAAAALLRDGAPVAAAEEERFTRRRHDADFPSRAIRFCLQQGGITVGELDRVVFYEKPLRKFERIISTHLRSFPRSAGSFSRTMHSWLGDRLWMKNRIVGELGIDPGRVLFTEQHQAHAASAFYASPFSDAAVLTVTTVGEWATTSLGHGRDRELELLAETHFPHSLGLLCSAVAAFLGFSPGDGQQAVMDLAAYGEPTHAEQLSRLIEIGPDGSFRLDRGVIRYPYDPERGFGPKLRELLGEPRPPGGTLRFVGEDRRHADVAASLQQVVEQTLLALARALHRRVESDNLCVAGTLAENAVANARLLRDGPFERLFVQPAPGNAGAALGAALFVQHQLLRQPRCYVQSHVYLGEPVRDDPQPGALEIADEEELIDHAAAALAAGEIVGWVQGRFEWGSSGLGHRAIFADPREETMRARLSRDIKHEEPFRPFAAVALAERAAALFELPPGSEWPTRFMLLAVRAKRPGVELVPATLRIDSTARVQLVHRESEPQLHRLLERFAERTGVPALLCAALNLRGDPLARTETDALDLLHRSHLDALFVGRRVYRAQVRA